MKYIYTDLKYMFYAVSRDLSFCYSGNSQTQPLTGILWVFVCEQMCSIYTGKKEQIIFCYEKPYNKIIGFHFTSQVSKSPGKQINLMCFKFGPADLRSKSMTAWYIISATWSLGYPSCPVPMAGNTRVV